MQISDHNADEAPTAVAPRIDPGLLVSEGRFAELAADHNPDTQLVVDPAGNIRFVGGNIETLVGLSREEAMAMSIWEYVHPEDFESAAGAFNEATRTTGYHLPTAFRIRGAGDEWIEAEITGTTFDCLEGVWLVIAIRRVRDRDEVIHRRKRIETLIREASTACAAATWLDVDNVVANVLEGLVEIVDGTAISMGWETDGVLSMGAVWPGRYSLPVGASYDRLWSREDLASSLLKVCLDLNELPNSWLRDRMLADGVRAVIEIPLSDESPWGFARIAFRGSAQKWDDANVDLVKVLATTLMSTIWRCIAERHLQAQATTDALTGLMNRSELYRTLDEFMSDRRGSGRVAVFYGDLDNFKLVNDLHGHDKGDDLLIAVADALRSSVRAIDVIARIGGDEFIILCPDIDELNQLDHIRRRIVDSVGKIDTYGVPVGMSLGMALAEVGESSNDLLKRADALMYGNKRASSTRVLFEEHGRVPELVRGHRR